MSKMSFAIDVENLSKKFLQYRKAPGIMGSLTSLYKREVFATEAIKDVSLQIRPGEIVGLLGPNGAGKTTLMKMFTGIVVPSSGALQVLGFIPHQRRIAFRQRIALVMGQKSQLWWDIPAMDSFRMLQHYYSLDKSRFLNRLKTLSELLEVAHLLEIHVRKLSLGERMKMELMASLLHDPEIIFLDEPTIGLDVAAQIAIRAFLKDYHRQNNCTLILTSHYMADVEALCERLILVMGGRKSFDGRKEQFSSLLGHQKQVVFRFNHKIAVDHHLLKDFKPIWSEDGCEVELKIPEEQLRTLSSRILSELPVIDFSTGKLPIEKVMEELILRPELINAG